MTSDVSRGATLGLLLLGCLTAAVPARAADPAYPFEGTWVRVNRICTANAPRVRTYTAHEVISPSSHCAYRKVAQGGGQFEIFEDCRRAERPGNYTETIRMLGPDVLQMRRQAARLKIARPLRYARCSIAAPAPGGAAKPAGGPHHAEPRGAEEHPPKPAEARPAEPKGIEPKPPEPKPPESKPPEPKP